MCAHTAPTIQHKGPGTDRLTYFELLAEDRAFAERRAVPTTMSELKVTLRDPQLRSLSDENHRIGSALADGPLPG